MFAGGFVLVPQFFLSLKMFVNRSMAWIGSLNLLGCLEHECMFQPCHISNDEFSVFKSDK